MSEPLYLLRGRYKTIYRYDVKVLERAAELVAGYIESSDNLVIDTQVNLKDFILALRTQECPLETGVVCSEWQETIESVNPAHKGCHTCYNYLNSGHCRLRLKVWFEFTHAFHYIYYFKKADWDIITLLAAQILERWQI